MELKDYCPTIYGPVHSRRHGLSLGINLGDPGSKACTWSCIYCQCGFGHRVEATSSRLIPPVDKVLRELEQALDKQPTLDSVTMAGNTEPTAHPQFLEIVQGVLALRERRAGVAKKHWIFNALSNGSELDDPSVVQGCDLLDEIWVKLDCAEDKLFKKLNRPVPGVLNVEAHLKRIEKLKKPCLQTLLWLSPQRPELSNWTEENLDKLLAAYQLVRPAQVFITTVQREPAMSGLEPVPGAEIEAFASRVRAAGLDVKVFV